MRMGQLLRRQQDLRKAGLVLSRRFGLPSHYYLCSPGGIVRPSTPPRVVASWHRRIPNSTIPAPKICQGPSRSLNMIQAPHAATTGCSSNVTDDVKVGKYFNANTSKPCPPACVI